MRSKLNMAILLLLALTLFLPAGCAQKVAPSESAKGEIVVGIIEDLSGPSGGMGTPAVAGMTDCIRYINEEKGGVSGHPLRAIVVDNKMDSAITISAWDRMKSEGVPIVMSNFAGAAAFVMHEACQRDHIPMTAGTGTIDLLFPKEPSYYFSVGPQTAGTIDAMCKIIEKEWAQKGEKRAPKIGFDFVSVGTMPVIMSKGAKMYSEKRGWQYNITRTSLAPADVTTQVLQMKQFGCDYLYLMTTEAGSVAWFKELQRQSFRPIIFGAPGLSSEELWRAVGELCVGARSYQFSAQWTDIDIPLVVKARELSTKWHPEVTTRPSQYIKGYADVLVYTEAMKRAVEKVGVENLNGEAMKTAMETINKFEPMGLGIGYVWTPTDHQGIPGIRWYQRTAEGKLAPVSGWVILDPLPEEQRAMSWWLAE